MAPAAHDSDAPRRPRRAAIPVAGELRQGREQGLGRIGAGADAEPVGRESVGPTQSTLHVADQDHAAEMLDHTLEEADGIRRDDSRGDWGGSAGRHAHSAAM